jgi:plasmid stabilization system protein ParE
LRIDYLPLSTENIHEIKRHYLKLGGNQLALKMIRKIRAEVATLSDSPNRASAYELAPGVRRLVVAGGIFLVFYRVTNIIEILHVRRSEKEPVTSMDIGCV